jgi:hypothetical protein
VSGQVSQFHHNAGETCGSEAPTCGPAGQISEQVVNHFCNILSFIKLPLLKIRQSDFVLKL